MEFVGEETIYSSSFLQCGESALAFSFKLNVQGNVSENSA